jgi:hypothetical protein
MPDTLSKLNGQVTHEESSEILYQARSEEVQDIMGNVPSWITRWGITLMATLFTGILVGTALFKYPDIIPAKVTVSSANPPVKIIARNNLPIQKIFVSNNTNVTAGQILCVLSNSGSFDDIMFISALSRQIDTAVDLRALAARFNPGTLNLGDLQNDYIVLLQSLRNYDFFLSHNGYSIMVGHLKEQSGYQYRLSEHLARNNARLNEQLSIQEQRFRLDSSLVAQTVMSKVEYENAKKDLLNQQINTDGNHTTILQSKLQEKDIQKNLSDAIIQFQKEENDLLQKIRDAANSFNGHYSQWEQNYVMRTPVSGKVVFFKYWNENQFVKAGEVIMIVTPPVQQYIARGDISVLGAGKAKPGQRVLIRLFAYPYEEYGSLKGHVKSKSIIALDTTFAIEISLEDGLHTNAAKQIPQQAQLEGIAEIMTANKSLLERLFENIYGKRRQ